MAYKDAIIMHFNQIWPGNCNTFHNSNLPSALWVLLLVDVCVSFGWGSTGCLSPPGYVSPLATESNELTGQLILLEGQQPLKASDSLVTGHRFLETSTGYGREQRGLWNSSNTTAARSPLYDCSTET